ncbi:hypothetical protein C8R43DRAFT_888163 [Mycena crocata]|nr:hypothetical protein C8R43DRAFT_888163 [Mycena crocata]
MASDTTNPPPYAKTVLDQTHRSISYLAPKITSMANSPNLLGYLVNHSPDTNGSFSICLAGGVGVFISQKLFELIPVDHHPSLDTGTAGQTVPFSLVGGSAKIIGTILLPFILTTITGERIRLVLHALVLPKLFMGMFIGKGGQSWLQSEAWGRGNGPLYTFDFGQAGEHKVQGI